MYFKDPGVQHYGGKLFNNIRDKADEIFVKLPLVIPEKNTQQQQYNYGGYGGGHGGSGGKQLLKSNPSLHICGNQNLTSLSINHVIYFFQSNMAVKGMYLYILKTFLS